jgi:hypothetical protein
MARMSAAQLEELGLIRAIPRRALGAEERLIDKPVGPDIIILTMFSGNFAPG